ncbi:uncharacterized protein LOC109849786 [Asparagus officinalis]|uniref:uncharacterized protein LOC109849786 n=1 Tax=Asparagus officinalis TaxID=4686 RepID=UPI00098E7993|nr:uncharacterized protein LOC109849786 [Asparagus officinalis]
MEKKISDALSIDEEQEQRVRALPVPSRPHEKGETSFYEAFLLRGIRVRLVRPGFLSCTFKVPPRFTDKDGNLSPGAIANLVDEVGFSAIHSDGHPWKVSTDISISYMATAKLHDELEITSKVLGHKGGYSGTVVLLKNKLALWVAFSKIDEI